MRRSEPPRSGRSGRVKYVGKKGTGQLTDRLAESRSVFSFDGIFQLLDLGVSADDD